MMQQSKIPNNSHIGDELLSERMDDLLVPAETSRVDDHLALCDECAARYAGLLGTRAVLRSLRVEAAPRDFRLDAGDLSRKKVVAIRHISRPQRWLSVAALICGICLIAFGLFSAAVPSVTHNFSQLGSGAPAPSSANVGSCPTCPRSAPQATHVPSAGISSTVKTPQATKTPNTTQTPTPDLPTLQRGLGADSVSVVPFLVITLGLLVLIGGMVGLFFTRSR